MATTYKVYVNGVYKTFTAAEYEAEFGYKPSLPREGERLWGGRYEHRTFAVDPVVGSVSGSLGEYGVHHNTGNSTTSSRAGGY
tara:strand:- start:274 stop:522 length:249 start_codon:yes stop_codon:yes gene_type:complete